MQLPKIDSLESLKNAASGLDDASEMMRVETIRALFLAAERLEIAAEPALALEHHAEAVRLMLQTGTLRDYRAFLYAAPESAIHAWLPVILTQAGQLPDGEQYDLEQAVLELSPAVVGPALVHGDVSLPEEQLLRLSAQLAERDFPEALPVLEAIAAAVGPAGRVLIAHTLGTAEDANAAELLVQLAEDEDAEVRSAAICNLTFYAEPSHARIFESGFSEPDLTLKEKCASILLAMAPDRGRSLVEPLAESQTGDEIRLWLRLAAEGRVQTDPETVSRHVTHSEVSVRVAAARALQKFDHPAAVKWLSALVQDSEESVRVAAIEALLNSRGEGRTTGLSSALADPAPWIQSIGIRAALRFREVSAREPLLALCAQGSVAVREEARDAVSQLFGAEALSELPDQVDGEPTETMIPGTELDFFK